MTNVNTEWGLSKGLTDGGEGGGNTKTLWLVSEYLQTLMTLLLAPQQFKHLSKLLFFGYKFSFI